jgi:type IV pilus assembly protein PilE
MIKDNVSHSKALTLIELLIVLVIIGILAALALPRFLSMQAKVKSSEARGMLKAALVLEKAYYGQHGRYSASLDSIGFVQSPLVTDQPPGKARYRLTVPVASAAEVRITATSVIDFDGDGQYSAWVIDQSGHLEELVTD